MREVLLADDDADFRLAIRLSLEQAGYAVQTAANANEALRLQRRRPAHVLVTDIFMPDGDGFEAIDAFRREFPATKIVVVSGGGQRGRGDYLAAARLVGAHATLQKPFDVDALLEALRAL